MGERAHDPWFDNLLARYHDRLVWFVRGLLGDEQYALDVAQEVFVAAWRARQQQAPPFVGEVDEAGARRWLYRVAYNRSISLLRRRRRAGWDSLEQIASVEEERFYAPIPFEDQVAEAEALSRALARLNPDDAVAVLLYVVHDFTAWEVAHVLDVSPAAAAKRIWRAKERLRSAYFAQQAEHMPVRGQG